MTPCTGSPQKVAPTRPLPMGRVPPAQSVAGASRASTESASGLAAARWVPRGAGRGEGLGAGVGCIGSVLPGTREAPEGSGEAAGAGGTAHRRHRAAGPTLARTARHVLPVEPTERHVTGPSTTRRRRRRSTAPTPDLRPPAGCSARSSAAQHVPQGVLEPGVDGGEAARLEPGGGDVLVGADQLVGRSG